MSDLSTLEKIRSEFGAGLAERKLALLERLAKARLQSARAVHRLHEVLCFLRAYPDDARVLERVEAMLEAFDRRADLERHAGRAPEQRHRRHADRDALLRPDGALAGRALGRAAAGRLGRGRGARAPRALASAARAVRRVGPDGGPVLLARGVVRPPGGRGRERRRLPGAAHRRARSRSVRARVALPGAAPAAGAGARPGHALAHARQGPGRRRALPDDRARPAAPRAAGRRAARAARRA